MTRIITHFMTHSKPVFGQEWVLGYFKSFIRFYCSDNRIVLRGFHDHTPTTVVGISLRYLLIIWKIDLAI